MDSRSINQPTEGNDQGNGEDWQGPRKEDIPTIEFDTVDDAEVFYKDYANALGFGYRKSSNRYDLNRMLIMKIFCCNKEGHKEAKWLNNSNAVRRGKAVTRTGCNAHLHVVLDKNFGKWVVSQFENAHNHDMVSVSQRCCIRSNRRMTEADITEAKKMKQSGVRTCQVMNYLAHQAEGMQNIGFMKKDLYNRLWVESQSEILDGDANAILMYLDIKSSIDEGLYFRHTTDSANRLQQFMISP